MNSVARFVIYVRHSTDMQYDMSLEAQEAVCRDAIDARNGQVAGVYKDSAKSGWSLDRDGFIQLRADASQGKFDAVMFWKFDRLARNHDHIMMIKALLRYEYGIRLYCVEGFSEDDDDSPHAMMMEQLLAVFAAFYSKNLSTDTKRAKRARAMRGEFNGSVAPLGYDFITQAHATASRPSGLYINPVFSPIILGAFEQYATGLYSDRDIADWMNQQPAIQELRQGRKPIDKEFVRDMLQNRVYTGRIGHSDTRYNEPFNKGKQSTRHREEWFEGKHEGFISDELFEKCLDIRRSSWRKGADVHFRTYLLNDRVFCMRCLMTKPHDLIDENYGKMRVGWIAHNQKAYYRCMAWDRGYEKCGQSRVNDTIIDEQVLNILFNLNLHIPPADYDRVQTVLQARLDNDYAQKRMADMQKIMRRIDVSWENGLLPSEAEYLNQRVYMKRQFEARRHIHEQEVITAHDLLSEFHSYWEQLASKEDNLTQQRQLLQHLVDKVLVYHQIVVAICLCGYYWIRLSDDNEVSLFLDDFI